MPLLARCLLNQGAPKRSACGELELQLHPWSTQDLVSKIETNKRDLCQGTSAEITCSESLPSVRDIRAKSNLRFCIFEENKYITNAGEWQRALSSLFKPTRPGEKER